MINTTYLIYLVKTYFSTVFLIWVIGNILLRVLIKKKKKKRKVKGKKVVELIWAFVDQAVSSIFFIFFLVGLFLFSLLDTWIVGMVDTILTWR